jgi:membrane AbrB-like protein
MLPARLLPWFSSLVRLAETLLIAAVGGAIFTGLGFPAGWLSGAMVAVAVAALAGRPMSIPAPLTRVVFVAVGISLGAAVTPETLRGVATWPFSVALLLMAVLAATMSSAFYLRKVHRWDTLSALFGSMPGALSQVISFATHNKSDLRGIAIVQTIRVVILAACLPAALAAFGLVDPASAVLRRGFDAPWHELAVVVTVCSAIAALLQWIRFPGGLIFGAMLASAIMHGAGWTSAVLPGWAVNVAMVSLGAITGSRFANTELRLLLRYLAAAFGSFAVAIAVVTIFAWIAVSTLSLRVPDVVVSYAPGALDVMMILSLALHLDPIFVGAHHVARFMLVSLSLPIFVRLFGGKQ